MTQPMRLGVFKVPALLLLLSIVPTIGGSVRIMSVARGAPVGPDTVRFLTAPAPVLLHIATASLYCLLGAFQFSTELRRRWPRFHRRAGVLLSLCGIVTGASGVWMTTRYAIPAALQGPLLYAVRVLVGSAMVASIVVAWRSILRRDIASHEAFMIRAYALGQGAGTQVLVLAPWMLISGESGGLARDLLMTLSWVINIVAAELIISARQPRRAAELGDGRGV